MGTMEGSPPPTFKPKVRGSGLARVSLGCGILSLLWPIGEISNAQKGKPPPSGGELLGFGVIGMLAVLIGVWSMLRTPGPDKPASAVVGLVLGGIGAILALSATAVPLQWR